MKLIQLENALRKAGTEFDAVQKLLSQCEKAAVIADEKSAIAKRNYKQAKKESRQARKEARSKKEELATARDRLISRVCTIDKLEAKLLKARKKAATSKNSKNQKPKTTKSAEKNVRQATEKKNRRAIPSRKSNKTVTPSFAEPENRAQIVE